MKILLNKIKKHIEIARSKGPTWFYYKYIYAKNTVVAASGQSVGEKKQHSNYIR